jgi:hypothetical protein
MESRLQVLEYVPGSALRTRESIPLAPSSSYRLTVPVGWRIEGDGSHSIVLTPILRIERRPNNGGGDMCEW